MITDTINDAVTRAGGAGALLAGRYRIVRQLGQGGMGSVWLAEDTQLDNKLFAIKMLPSILVSNKRAYRQLKDEALVAMQLVHPNIVQIRAFEENDGNPFLVMDYVDGQTLDDYLAEHAHPLGEAASRRFTGTTGILPVDVLRILRPIATALDYAHSKGVVHRDVKPGNVMIAKDGTPYILDFGIAREIQETMTRVTGKLSSGTLLYMSPEQLMGEPPKPAQDIYSFAAMAYECLKGEPPFSHGQIEFQIMNKRPAPLATDALTGKAAILAAGVMSGLAKRPEDRPATCVAVLEGKDFSRVERVDRVEGIGGARRPAEPVGSHVPRDRVDAPQSGGSRSRATAKIILAAALLAALAGGAWWFVNKRAARPTGTTGVPSVATEADVAEIAVEATVQKARVERIDDADRFMARKNSLADTFVRATAYGKAKRWADAAQEFTNYVNGCKELLELNQERQSAKESKAKAEDAKARASEAKASQYAEKMWNKASALLKEANALVDKRFFVDATSKYAAAAKQFDLCVGDANAVRKRQEEEAAAKAKAEKEKREREEAEPQKARGGDVAQAERMASDTSFDQDPNFVRCTDVVFAPVYFGFDASNLQASEMPKIEAVATHLKQTGRVVIVEGHCDEEPNTPSPEYMLSLGELRAIAVRDYFVMLGINEQSVETKSYGNERRAVLGHNEEAWSKNRRCEFAVFQRKQGVRNGNAVQAERATSDTPPPGNTVPAASAESWERQETVAREKSNKPREREITNED